MKNPLFLVIIAALLSVNFGLLAWLWFKPSLDDTTQTLQVVDCDLNTSGCRAGFDWQGQPIEMQISINPQPVPIARPLSLSLHFSAPIQLEKASVEITGVNMYMGFNRQALEQKSPTEWQGSTILAFCTESAMQWQVQIQLTDTSGQMTLLNVPLNTFRK
jgi:hypothetical protein